ncbi:hypothetical protein Y032_0029g1940 [Ancylostoma ceylanicum]|uniref:Peptidase A1 domain-containing protein n=1 Tax=Ancylostoma ceylanicum TaxID=53326 RepID=A0A016UR51_9BILA|nr:hypothetical protein Y032_0029g1940 [Ancylostoma ceylanicum]
MLQNALAIELRVPYPKSPRYFGGLFVHQHPDVILHLFTTAYLWGVRREEVKTLFCGGHNDLHETVIETLHLSSPGRYDLSNELYFIECDAQPAINFLIGKKKYTVRAKNLIIEVQENLCILALSHFSSAEQIEPQWFLGYPFIREYCLVFEMEAKKVGFSKARHS